MTIDGTTLGPWEQIYTFVRNDGRNIHIHSPRLRSHCLQMNYKPILAPVDTKLAQSFLRDNIVSPWRIKQLMEKISEDKALEPIILCKTEAYGHPCDLHTPEVLLVDGHHRYTIAALAKSPVIIAWLLELHQWQPFTVIGIPDYTNEALKAEPIIPKPHWRSK